MKGAYVGSQTEFGPEASCEAGLVGYLKKNTKEHFVLDKKNIINGSLAAAAAINLTTAFADAPSTDPRYEVLKRIMREYVQQVVQDECSTVEGYNFDSYEWSAYEIRGLEVVLFDILNHTNNYCKPPELTGTHSAKQNQGDDAITK